MNASHTFLLSMITEVTGLSTLVHTAWLRRCSRCSYEAGAGFGGCAVPWFKERCWVLKAIEAKLYERNRCITQLLSFGSCRWYSRFRLGEKDMESCNIWFRWLISRYWNHFVIKNYLEILEFAHRRNLFRDHSGPGKGEAVQRFLDTDFTLETLTKPW